MAILYDTYFVVAVSFIFFVGRGIGPLISTPVLSAISFMKSQVSLIFVMSMLANLILAFCIKLEKSEFVFKAYGFGSLKINESVQKFLRTANFWKNFFGFFFLNAISYVSIILCIPELIMA